MEVLLHQLDAFADAPFSGNPAAVMPLLAWLPDELLQRLAEENNLAETAFYTSALPAEAGAPPDNSPAFHLRWFTPTVEVDLCGHATMAAAAQILDDMHPGADRVHFYTRSGWLRVDRDRDDLVLDLPSVSSVEIDVHEDVPNRLAQALGVRPLRAFEGTDVVLFVTAEDEVRQSRPDFSAFPAMNRAAILTAEGDEVDFVSRVFAPGQGIPEDPVTGSAHAQLTPLWSRELGRTTLRARQLSRRGGSMRCHLRDDRVRLTGRCRRYLDGVVRLPD
ncbi:PhzF family phenazine biosynthesis protein [Nocardia seriolae]|uniref:PhzF family phenazine biosynthesis protein n=1 Tax=Nocardia seriolae TaxID=37332 RepID=UPI0008FF4136|nr:PhzF family phenazine biosynthesis protein [Nocardia seriolae]OJF81579.1 isomerase [Nocardia seriolae]PSK31025.1 PhzF family phenazine biosynthesis protein [Nocardia seriolae]QOW34404.1 PhzF family phenazine biosynthesis protein [Nocardia seriolae]QUN18141.1 PhzF family phenazine biosynthesis protein [Nocardia seriolae]WNJ61599.1 PhzF family phenazine biosynthesis protein [Nocardia seriolae]